MPPEWQRTFNTHGQLSICHLTTKIHFCSLLIIIFYLHIFTKSSQLKHLSPVHHLLVITTFIDNCLSAYEHCISLVGRRFWTHLLCGAWNRADEPVRESRMGQMKKKMTHASPSVISVIHSPSIAEWQLHQEPSTAPRTTNSTDKPNFTHCTQFQCRRFSKHLQPWRWRLPFGSALDFKTFQFKTSSSCNTRKMESNPDTDF